MAISEIATIPNLPFGNTRNPKPFKLPSNPKILGFRCESEMIERSPTPIIDRFRFLLRDRDEKLKISEEEDDVAEVYEIVLAELTHNSKPIITELTMIAEEQREHAEGIANAICNQIREVPSEQKLPSLYLLDSIVKNIGYEYIEYFASRLPEVFCQTYKQVQRGKHGAMQLLFGTWPAVFPPSVLQKIRTELKFSPPVNHRSPASASSESPSQGIHVNFKQLDAGHQFEHTTTDVQDARGISSYVQRCGQKPHFGYDEHSIYQTDIISNHVEIKRLKSPGRDTHTSEGKVERLISPKTKPIRPSSPAESLSPSDDQLQTDNSSRRALQKASPSRCGFQNPPGRVNKRVTKKNDWSVESLSPSGDPLQTNNSPKRAVRKVSPSRCGFQNQPRRVNKGVVKKNNWGNNHSLDRNNRYTESYNMCDFSNLNDLDRPRALIEAYGRDSREDNLYEKPPKTDWHDLNGINRETATRSWQNTDDNEYVWEEMSPKLAGRSMNNEVMVPKLNFGNISTIMGTEDAGVLSKLNIRMGNWPRNPKLPTVSDSAIIAEEEISKSGGGTAGDESVFGSEGNKNHDLYYPRHPWNEQKNFSDGIAGDESLFGSGIQTEANKKRSPYQPHHPWNKQKNFVESSRKRNLEACRNAVQTSAPSSEPILPTCERMPFVMDNLENSSSIAPAVVKKHLGKRSCSSPKEPQLRPQVDVTNSQPPPSPPILPHQKQTNGQFFLDARKQLINQGRNDGSILPQQQFDDVVESKTFDSRKLPHLPLPLEGLASLNNQHQGQVAPSPPQVLKYQEVPSIQIHSVSSTSFQLQGVPLTPLPPGTPPASSQMRPSQVVDPIASQLPSQTLVPIASHPSAVSAFSGLISSLMAYGLISLTAPSTIQDSVGVEFKTDLLKVRQESVITTLYADLPRQCTTCGLRFKCQEDHRNHMDWHVTKNRTSKNRKQKQSRNWFVSTNLWLSSTEALESDAVPEILPTETVMEKKVDEDMAVPADENQNTCALCGEPFDDFYSHETEEWMYRGAVYLNEPPRSSGNLDRSQFGPIVHAKCRPTSTSISPEDIRLNEWGNVGESRQTKRMRF